MVPTKKKKNKSSSALKGLKVKEVEEITADVAVGLSPKELEVLADFQSDLRQRSGKLGAHKGARANGGRKEREVGGEGGGTEGEGERGEDGMGGGLP